MVYSAAGIQKGVGNVGRELGREVRGEDLGVIGIEVTAEVMKI